MSRKLTFYYGAASGSSRIALQKMEEENVMISYGTKNNSVWGGIENLFIDSGGYRFISLISPYVRRNSIFLYITTIML